MAGATLTTADAIAKEVYEPKIVALTNDEAIGLKRIEKSSEGVETTVGGKYVTFPVRVTRNQGIGYRDENEPLPTPGRQGYASVRVPIQYGYAGCQVTGQVMKLIKTNYQAFASAMDREMTGLKDDVVKDCNRIFYGDGKGTLATVTADAANAVTVDDVRFLEDGMAVDIVSSGGTVRASNRTITISGSTVTYSGADASVSIVATDILVRPSSYNREPQGLKSIVAASGTLFNVDPTTYSKWKAVDNSNGGVNRALSELLMIETVDDVRVQGGKTSLILTSLGVRRQYFALLTQQRRYADTKEFAGGFTGLVFHHGREIPVVDDVDAPSNKMWFLDESSLKVYQEGDWAWDDTAGGIWERVTDSNGRYDAYQATLQKYWELAVERRNSNGLLGDITE